MCAQVGEQSSESPIVKAKAVVAVRELLVTPTKLIQCIAAGVTPALLGLLKVKRLSCFNALDRITRSRPIVQQSGGSTHCICLAKLLQDTVAA